MVRPIRLILKVTAAEDMRSAGGETGIARVPLAALIREDGFGSEAEIHGTGTASTQCPDSSPPARYRPHKFYEVLSGEYSAQINEILLSIPTQFLYLIASEFAEQEVAHAAII